MALAHTHGIGQEVPSVLAQSRHRCSKFMQRRNPAGAASGARAEPLSRFVVAEPGAAGDCAGRAGSMPPGELMWTGRLVRTFCQILDESALYSQPLRRSAGR